MLRSMFKAGAQHKRFDYQPRFYKPERERSPVDRIKFESKVRRGQGRSVVALATLMFLALYIIYLLGS